MEASRAPAHHGTDALDLLGVSPSGARIIRYFLLRPQANPHARELQRVLALGGRSLQRELQRLVALGALDRREDGRLVRYGPVGDSGLWRSVRLLLRESTDPIPLLQAALTDVSGLLAAFVFGSTARGTQRENSDIDLFILEEPDVDRKKLLRQLTEASLLLERQVNPVRYTSQKLAERLADRRHPAFAFVRNALTGAKRWIVGDPGAFQPLATAAGIGNVAPVGASR